MIDIHAHILPGIDDGARDWEETRTLLRIAADQGIDHIVATPHFSRKRDPEALRELYRQACRESEAVGIRLSLGQEILYFEELPRYLEEGRALTLAQSRYVLVEFHPQDGYTRLCRAVRDLVQAGYFPVLAHVERYPCLRKEGRTAELIQSGAYLQINADSLLGGIFDRQFVWCKRETMNKRVHFIATDMHRADSRPPHLGKVSERMAKLDKKGQTERLFADNPRCILEDRML